MKTITIPGFIHAKRAESWEAAQYGPYRFDWRPYEAKNLPDKVDVTPMEITFSIPADWNPVPDEIASLEAKRTEVMAEAQEQVNRINDLIGKLQALTFEAA